MRLVRAAFWLALAASSSMACNAIIDNHDRQLDERALLGDAGDPKDASKDVVTPPDGTSGIDTGTPDADSGPVTIVVGKSWKSPNGAVFTTNDAGTTITGFTDAGHAAIVPTVQPNIPSEDYTVVAQVRAPTNGEFGVMARAQPTDDFALFASKYGSENTPFLGNMGPPQWSPVRLTQGQQYTFTPGARYMLMLRVVADQVSGKMWQMGTPEPASFQVLGIIPWKTGRGVGFYIYNTYDAVLESMVITVP